MKLFNHRQVAFKLLWPLFLVGLLVVGSVLVVVSYTQRNAVEQAGLTTGQALSNQIVTLRSFYTAEISARAKKAGMQLGSDFRDQDNTLPLPATLVKALGENIAKEYPGTHVRLMSRLPFPNRAAESKLDAFQSESLAALERSPTTPQFRVEEINGRMSVRYAVADVMKEGCVACHNSHPQSPKRDWKIGDVRGLIEVVVPVDQLDHSLSRAASLLGGLVVVGFALLGLMLYALSQRVVSRPLNDAAAVMARVASGDLRESPLRAGEDEVSHLYASMRTMTTRLRETIGEVQQSAESIQMASSEVATGNQDFSSRTEQTATSLQQTASSMQEFTGTVRQTADAASTANQLVASASQVASRGGEVVSQVVSTMDEINQSSKKIADIIGVIDGIAFQTNILALNAAVEAARAGEQGRGFAVVASEVRSLAQRSAAAAREIKSLIGNSVEKVGVGSQLVQDAGATMEQIVASVGRVSDIIGEISAASSEQSGGISLVNTAVTQLDQMTQQNAALVEQGAAAAESLKEQAGNLLKLVSSFQLTGHGR